MVFHGAIDGSFKAYILYVLQDKQHKPRELSEKLGVSLATIYKIKKDGFECLKRKTTRVSPGRPRKIKSAVSFSSLMQRWSILETEHCFCLEVVPIIPPLVLVKKEHCKRQRNFSK